MTKKIRAVGAAILVVIWAALAVFAWLRPADATSDTERRPLAQFPTLNAQTLLGGNFMNGFEDYTLDQFPGRDAFRSLKSFVHYRVFGQKDNNGIYMQDGYAAKLDFPLNIQSLDYALSRLSYVYETYLQNTQCKVYAAVIPDKGYYLAEENGYPALDYDALFARVEEKLPFATYIPLTDCLSLEDYYYTDTHWRQEKLLAVAQRLCESLSAAAPDENTFTATPLERPFYGVYYGQAALPMDAETMYIMESPLLQACQVYNFETNGYTPVYNMELAAGKDMYEVYLSGSQALLRIENPNAATDRELVIFRDSFGSSVAPLLVESYKTVTLVDIRYLGSQMLGKYLQFADQDVLFIYSTLVLNNGTTLK